MEKINCNVIQDILPLYIDDVVSDDTKELVEEHLQNCEICQRVYHETKTDLENDMKISAQTKVCAPSNGAMRCWATARPTSSSSPSSLSVAYLPCSAPVPRRSASCSARS